MITNDLQVMVPELLVVAALVNSIVMAISALMQWKRFSEAPVAPVMVSTLVFLSCYYIYSLLGSAEAGR